jgi:uncharacterized protein YjbJ (UPF0337 family)
MGQTHVGPCVLSTGNFQLGIECIAGATSLFFSCMREAWSAPSTLGEIVINKDQVKGAVKDAAGKVQEQAAKLVGNKEQEAKGLKKQAEGKAEKALGDVKEVVKDAREAFKDAAKKH